MEESVKAMQQLSEALSVLSKNKMIASVSVKSQVSTETHASLGFEINFCTTPYLLVNAFNPDFTDS